MKYSFQRGFSAQVKIKVGIRREQIRLVEIRLKATQVYELILIYKQILKNINTILYCLASFK